MKKGQKGGVYRAGPMWMQRGMQGHVVEPHRPTCVPAWHECDVYIYYIYLYISYSTYKHSIEELANRYNRVTLYTRSFLLISSAWD